MKKKGCCIGCAVVLLVALVLVGLILYAVLGSDTYVTEDIAYYRAISGETDGPNSLPILGEQVDIYCPYELPYLDDLAPYEDYRFNYTARRAFIFESHAYILIAEYDETAYAGRKAELEAVCIWREEEIRGEAEGVNPNCALDGFEFRCAEGGDYPKEMLLVGTNDGTREIAYIYFFDQDLDYIRPDMPGFLLAETGWKEVAGK